ncbi:MAG: hypothetical protein Q9181_005891 [Wetmoreana brouardii]
MRSQLTRRVFRQIIYTALYADTCCSCRPMVDHQWRARKSFPSSMVPSRALFGFSRLEPARKQKPPDYKLGLKEMMQLSQALAKHERPPQRATLVEAFTTVILDHTTNKTPLTEDSDIGLLLATFRYLQETQVDNDDLGLSVEEMLHALNFLRNAGPDSLVEAPNLITLARALSEAINHREEAPENYAVKAINALIAILAARHRPLEARELLEKLWEKDPSQVKRWQWQDLMVGFARVGDQEQLVKTIDMMKNWGIRFDSGIHESLILFYTSAKNVDMMKKWYGFGIANGVEPTRQSQMAVLRLCSFTNNIEYGEPIMRSYLDKSSTNELDRKATWTLILRWAAAKGKGFEELDRLLSVLVQKSKDQGLDIQPDIRMINGLISMANFKKDAYAAERYLALARKWNLKPDDKTLRLQLEYRIDSNDLDGAKATYDELKSNWRGLDKLDVYEPMNKAAFDLMNRLIVALCNQRPVNYNLIMELVGDLDERRGPLSPDTVSALALLHLQRGELHELVDLLNTHVYRFSVEQRAVVCRVFVDYCLDPSVLTAKVWDAYNILRRTFAELDTGRRTKIMLAFFDRGRSDMATHVFGHMRHLDMPSMRPTTESYVLCFEGIAKAADSESLGLVHNMLKLDNIVELDTRLYNALMLAYTGCGDPGQSLLFWDDIIHSREGPTYNSILIALRACEEAPFGERRARDIWSRLKRFEIRVTRETYAAYVGALAGQSLFDECVELINNAKGEAGYSPDVLLLGTFHNALPGAKQEVMEKWAVEAYPDVWTEVKRLSKRRKRGSYGYGDGVVYNINRDVRA